MDLLDLALMSSLRAPLVESSQNTIGDPSCLPKYNRDYDDVDRSEQEGWESCKEV